MVTKGYEFSSLAQSPGGSTQIRTVVSRWKVEKGVAHARDVALTTRDNRIALQGGLDFVDDEFDEVFVALVDANGCAKLRQRVRGPFGKPVVEKPAVLASLTGPVLNLLGKARTFSRQGHKCEVFLQRLGGAAEAPNAIRIGFSGSNAVCAIAHRVRPDFRLPSRTMGCARAIAGTVPVRFIPCMPIS